MSTKSLHHLQEPVRRQFSRRKGIDSKIKKESLNTGSPLEWYRLTENSRNVLNSLITFAAREKIKESKKNTPDTNRMEYLKGLYQEAHEVSQDSSRFESLESMKSIVKHYNAILEHVRIAR